MRGEPQPADRLEGVRERRGAQRPALPGRSAMHPSGALIHRRPEGTRAIGDDLAGATGLEPDWRGSFNLLMARDFRRKYRACAAPPVWADEKSALSTESAYPFVSTDHYIYSI